MSHICRMCCAADHETLPTDELTNNTTADGCRYEPGVQLTFFFLSGLTRSASVFGPRRAAICLSSSCLMAAPSTNFKRALIFGSRGLAL